MIKDVAEVLASVVVGPADRLVLVFPADFRMEQADHVREALKRSGFEDRVLMVAGVEELAVLRGDTDGE